jgi:adenosine deaminase
MKKKEKMMKKNLKLFKMSRYRVVNVVISEDIIEKFVFIYIIIIKFDNIKSQIYLFLIFGC